MNKNQKFFRDNVDKFAEELFNIGDKELLNLLRTQKANRDIILNEIANILLKYEISDDIVNIPSGIQTKLYSDISKLIDKTLKGEFINESKNLGKLLINIGGDKYLSNSYLLSLGMDTKINKVNPTILNKIIDKTIQGKNYSDRYKANKEAIAKTLKGELKKFISGETSVNKISDIIKEKYNINANYSKRLVNNEVGRVQIAVNEEWLKDHDKYIEDVMWSATLESNTCSECGDLDGQTWSKDEKHPKPIDDTHVGCRCCIIALPSKNYRPTQRLNNNTKNKISWTTFNEWKENIE